MIDTIFRLLSEISQMNLIFLVLVVIVLIIVGLKVFRNLLKALLTGILFGLFPFIAGFVGLSVPLTVNSVISSALFGIAIYFVFSAMKTGFKITRWVLAPFRKMFRSKPKEKIIYREKEKD